MERIGVDAVHRRRAAARCGRAERGERRHGTQSRDSKKTRRTTPSGTSNQPPRRGVAIVVVVVLLVVVGLLILGMVHGGARDQALSIRRLETVQAFYAAEAGMNMAMREMMLGVDEDGDGTIGSISDDGDSGNDPSFGGANVYVTESTVAGLTTLTSKGRAGQAHREIQATLQ